MTLPADAAIKPCPFCGGEATRDRSYEVGPYFGCMECEVWQLGAEKWNRRTGFFYPDNGKCPQRLEGER
jgi:hypothetical protein